MDAPANAEGGRTEVAERTRAAWACAAFIFLLAVGGLLYGSAAVRPAAPDGLRIQPWSSDQMMQTLPASELRRAPFASLWYLHKQPPGLDAIRAVIANLAPDDEMLPRFVDTWLYVAWSVCHGITALLVFGWVCRIASLPVATAAAIGWLMHPAAIAYATFLESTALSALLILWFFYELRAAPTSSAASVRLTAATVLIFYTRTVFQWYFVPIFALCLWLLRVPARRAVAMIAVTAVLTGALVVKQVLLFGTLSTSTFTGYHHCGVLWHEPTFVERLQVATALDYHYPEGARRIRDPENTEQTAVDNLVLTRICSAHALEHPVEAAEAVGRSIAQNLEKYLRPSSRYTENLLSDALPWRTAYDFVFSGGMLVLLFASCIVVNLCALRADPRPRETLRAWAAYVVVFAYIFGVSNLGNRYAWVETDRIKFILEPVFFVFLVSSIVTVASWVSARRATSVRRRMGPLASQP